MINFCALKDLGYVGLRFTWLFQQRDGFQIRERDWIEPWGVRIGWVLFPRASLHHLSSSVSDHSPLSLHLKSRPCKRSKRRLFRFESMWLKGAYCEEIVKEEMCKVKLMRWNKEEFSIVGFKVAELQARLAFLET